ncbi:unnamed protein product [Prorocentrum cordatum]|nr:unnamed protein product [Polarella glacialis]
MRPMSLSGSAGPAGPPMSAYPAVPTQRLLSPARAPPPAMAADQPRYRDDFRHGGREVRAPGPASGGWESRAPRLEQERYAAPPTQRLDADDQCDDECLDADHCGAENRPPNPENLVCGMDVRPLLPVALAVSTVLGERRAEPDALLVAEDIKDYGSMIAQIQWLGRERVDLMRPRVRLYKARPSFPNRC